MRRIGRSISRAALRAWVRLGRAPVYQYQVINHYGYALAEPGLLPSRLPNGCRIFCDLRDVVQRLIWFHGAYEPIEAYLFVQLLQPEMVVIDAGANVGQYTLLAATAVGSSGAVHSFEPIPATFARLREHTTDNNLSVVRLNQAALWYESAILTLGMPVGQTNNAGAYSIRAGNDNASRVEARGVSLDEYASIQGITRVDLIKMDIEGAEPFALSGGRALIKEFRPFILMEINPAALIEMGSSAAALWAELSKLGYRIWRIGDSATASGPVPDLEGLGLSNALFHYADLPATVTSGWTLRTALRWARSGL